MKDSVVIPLQWFEMFKECACGDKPRDLCKYLDAIRDYVQTRQEPNFHGTEKLLWIILKQRLKKMEADE